jgi:AI2M/AI1M-like HNH endonuclease
MSLTSTPIPVPHGVHSTLGFTSEARWIRHAGAHPGHLFPYLPQQPGYGTTTRPGSTIQRDPPQARQARGHPRPRPGPAPAPRKKLIHRLRARRCELCEHGTTVAVHQVAKLTDLSMPGPGQPAWAALMARMRRKTLIVCTDCHDHIHATQSRTRHSHRGAGRMERCQPGSAGGCAEKAHNHTERSWDLAAQPVQYPLE